MIKNPDQRIFQNRFYDPETETLTGPIETQNYILVQVAESYYTHGFSIDDHRQICDLELTFSLMNGLLCSANGQVERVDKNGLHLCFRGETHGLTCKKSARFQTLAINFKDGPCLPLLQVIRERANRQRTFCIPDIFACLSEMIAEFMRADAPFSENHLDCLITTALVKLIRSGHADLHAEIPSYDENLTHMKNHIDTHFLQICSLEELSYLFGYTYSHISKIFKKAYGVTPKDYLLSRKFEYACGLLRDGAKLEEIANILGYSTAFNFSRAFKAHMGLAPGTYKKQFQKK